MHGRISVGFEKNPTDLENPTYPIFLHEGFDFFTPGILQSNKSYKCPPPRLAGAEEVYSDNTERPALHSYIRASMAPWDKLYLFVKSVYTEVCVSKFQK